MDSLYERGEYLLEELKQLVQDLLEAQAASDDEGKQTQLRHINKAISSLETVGAPIPDELRQLRIRLTTELNGKNTPNAIAERLWIGLNEIVSSLAPSTKNRRRTHVRTTPIGDPLTLEEGDLPPLGSRPISMLIGEEHIPLRTWRDVPVETANWMLANGYTLPADGIVGQNRYLLSADASQFRSPKPLSNGLYINTHYATPELVRSAYQLLASAGLSKETLQIEYSL